MKFSCPACGQHIEAPPQYSMQVIHCPVCGQSMQLPEIPETNVNPPKEEQTILVFRMAKRAAVLHSIWIYIVTYFIACFITPIVIFGICYPLSEVSSKAAGACIFLYLIVLLFLPAGIEVLRYFNFRYTLTDQRIIVRRGIFTTLENEIELYRVKDFQVRQGIIGKLFGYGTILVIARDTTTPATFFDGILHPIEAKERLRKLVRQDQTSEYRPNIHELL